MLPKLPLSYKFKYFFLAMGGNLLISNPNVASFFHGPQGSSVLLFSPCNSNPSNGDDDDDDVKFLNESNPTL